MQPLGERLGEPVRERLHHQRRIIIALRLELGDLLLDAEAGRHGKRAGVIRDPRARHEIGQTVIRLAFGPRVLLTQVVPDERRYVALRRVPQDDIVAIGVRRPESDDPARRYPPPVNDARKHRLRFGEQRPRRLADDSILEYCRI